jgi:SAM-dependent methyltransferase
MMSEDITTNEYLRQRYNPRPGDPHYLVLSDLLIAMRMLIPSSVQRALDYGAGGSPYKGLLGNCVYHRADLAGQSGVDFEYGPDARLPERVGGYDFVLSTQVLEHVEDPLGYLNECHRVLIPGGRLLLTTHGLFEDHGCPFDYWRWTVYGLAKIIKQVGFDISAIKRITTGPRATIFLTEQHLGSMSSSFVGAYGKTLALGIRAIKKAGSRRLHELVDASFNSCRVVDAKQSGHESYICIGVLALRT